MDGISEWLGAILAGTGSVATIGLAVVAIIGMVVWNVLSHRKLAKDPETLMALDAQLDKRRVWVQGASLILMQLVDNAYEDKEMITEMLSSSWGINNAQELDATVNELVTEQADNAWRQACALLLLRSAVAIGWLSNEASFDRCYEVGAQLQARYLTWDNMAQDVLRYRREYFGMAPDGSEDGEHTKALIECIDYLRKNTWRKTPWKLPLNQA